MISLSTTWRPREKPSKCMAAGRRAGFRAFELGMSIVPFDLRAVMKQLERHDLRVRSVHALLSTNDPPPPPEHGTWIAEPDAALRAEGVRVTKETLDLAREVGAGVVVLHCGGTPVPDAAAVQMELYRIISLGVQKPPYALLDKLVAERNRLAPAYLDALETSLKELCEHAPDMLLALENRYYISEIPHNDEFDRVFDRVGAPNLRYWHDVGHAHILERFGFTSQAGLLERNGSRLAGMHIHDITGFDDHRPPGMGDFDFGSLTAHLTDHALRVMEISSRFSAKEIARGREHLAEAYGIE